MPTTPEFIDVEITDDDQIIVEVRESDVPGPQGEPGGGGITIGLVAGLAIALG